MHVQKMDKYRPNCYFSIVTDEQDALDSRSREVLRALLGASAPVSGRRLAQTLGLSPTTVSNRLKALLDQGMVNAQPSGAAVLWSPNVTNPEVRAARRELESAALTEGGQVKNPADISSWDQPLAIDNPVVRVVILTALQLEYAAVRHYLNSAERHRTRSGTIYEVGRIYGNHLTWDAYLAEIDMGNVGAAAEVAGAVDAFLPDLILFVGIAGGLKPTDQNHGDIVVGSAVYNVHAGKIVPGPNGREQFLSRPVPVRISHRLSQLVMFVRRMDWSKDIPANAANQGGGLAKPDVLVRPIVAGEVVLADANSELRRRIAQQHNDAAAIDMESFGIYETAHRYDVPVLTVRGLSDLIGDKNPEADRELQPLAATNAAGFAMAVLRHAEEGDISRGPSGGGRLTGGPPGNPESPRGNQGQTKDAPNPRESLARLAPVVEPWWRRVRARHGVMADSIVANLAQRSGSPAGWLGRLRHRLPVWLRDDNEGDAWALVGAFAESHGSPHAAWLYDEAARRAYMTGLDIVAALNLFSAALATARRPYLSQSHHGMESAGPDDDIVAARAQAVELLSRESLRSFGPITAILCHLVNNDDQAVLAVLPDAMQVLGLDPGLYRQGIRVNITEEIELATSLFSELNETDPDLVDGVRCDLLMRTGHVLLEQSNIETALRFFGLARELSPATAAPLVGVALARLRRLDDSSSANRARLEVSTELAEIRQIALLARDRRRVWNVDSAEGVALAIRAQVFSDAEGALRLALPSPHGVATDKEAADPRVRESGALAALFVGNYPLALDLAADIADPVERDLTRAMVLSRSPGSGNEAEQALRRALMTVPDGRPDQLVRILLGLARFGVSILPQEPGNVSSELARLRDADPEAADLVEASTALHRGEPMEALVITRQYPQSVAAVELAAEAATDAGDHRQAFKMLERAGRTRGDEALLAQAMYLAVSSDLHDEARQVSDQLTLSVNAEMRRRGLEVRLMLAERAGQWDEVSDLGRRLIDDDTFELNDLHRGQHLIQYRWAIAGAEFNQRRIQQAQRAIDDPDELVPTSVPQAQLLLAILAASASSSGEGADPNFGDTSRYGVIERALAVGASFPDNEEVMASAIMVILSYPNAEPLPEALLSRVWKLQEDFFARFPDSSRFRRIAIGEDLSGLIEFLRANFAPGTVQLTDFARKVWLGLHPQSALAEVTSRSYSELLIKRLAGCLVACSADSSITAVEQSAANAAIEVGTAAIDTSALLLLERLNDHSRRLVAQFSRVLLPASMRDDILLTRNLLDLRSTGTLGWNPRLQRPQLTETPIETVDEWAEIGASLVKLLELLEIVPSKKAWSWDDSLQLASREGSALWADDVALREAARSSGIAAFGTLDLIIVLVETGRLSSTVLDQAINRFKDAYVVDLPLNDRFSEIAASESWEAKGYASLLLARPAFWNPPVKGFTEFALLVRSLVLAGSQSESIANWSASALAGLAWATPPAARTRALAGLIAWVTLSTDGAAIFPMLLDIGQDVMEAVAPSGDLIAQTVSVLIENLGQVVPTDQIGAIFTRLLVNLSPERRAEVMRSFFSPPRLCDHLVAPNGR
jgi:nucleoside phosphorylase/DNA-binding transcriptional ArsR family regulator